MYAGYNAKIPDSTAVAYRGAKVRQSIECLVALAPIDLLLAYSSSTSIWPIDKLHKLTTTKHNYCWQTMRSYNHRTVRLRIVRL